MDPNRKRGNPPVVLVVNDKPAQRGTISAVLEQDGLTVRMFSGCIDALIALEKGFRPDLIVTGLRMAGIDGWRFCRLLRSPQYAALNQVPILVVSSIISGEHASRISRDIGANAFLSAPFEGDILKQHVHALLLGESLPDISSLLIVEDDRDMCALLREAFEAHGYRVYCAYTAAEARASFKSHSPRTALIDYHLPDAPGDRLLKEFKQANPLAVVVMITADPSPSLAVELMRAGADAYAQKPFLAEYLLTLCQQASRERALLGVEAALQHTHARLEATLNALPDLMFEIDGEGRICDYRSPDPNLLFLPPDKFIGQKTTDVLPAPVAGIVNEAIAQAVQHGQHRGATYAMETALGTRWFELSIAVKEDARGANNHLIALARDITERKQMEGERQRLYEQTQRDASTKAELLNEVNHRVKNNLVAIKGLLLLEQRSTPGAGRGFVAAAMAHLSLRIEGLLKVHQMLSDSEWAPMRLSDLAESIVQTTIDAMSCGRTIKVEAARSEIEVSPRQANNLALIFNELTTNTLKHSRAQTQETHIAVRTWSEDDWIGIEYRDDGPGYPENVLRLDSHHVGLGLIQQLVSDTLRGRMTLTNNQGAVTTMAIKVEAPKRT